LEHGITAIITKLVFQLSVIIFAAKVAGELCERYLKQPGVLGELAIGMAIGPYALGGLISLPLIGVLFSGAHGAGASNIPVSTELYAIAQIAAVILLFMAGLETDLNQFIRYGGSAAAVAVGGVIFPFVLGAWGTVLFGLAESFKDPEALFMGAIMTATSVGITARVLRDIGKLDTPEGVTILGGAVVDDVLGILILAIVVSIAQSGSFSLAKLGIIGIKAVGFWLGLTVTGILLAKKISSFLFSFRSGGAIVALALALAFLASALAEMFGLAMIIGAYSMGLALSDSPVKETLERRSWPPSIMPSCPSSSW
jgi:Kef-type K+ transport system membrane component KefB